MAGESPKMAASVNGCAPTPNRRSWLTIVNSYFRKCFGATAAGVTEQSELTAPMTNYVNFVGFQNREKLADGGCPHCRGRITIWITSQGFELSSDDEI